MEFFIAVISNLVIIIAFIGLNLMNHTKKILASNIILGSIVLSLIAIYFSHTVWLVRGGLMVPIVNLAALLSLVFLYFYFKNAEKKILLILRKYIDEGIFKINIECFSHISISKDILIHTIGIFQEKGFISSKITIDNSQKTI